MKIGIGNDHSALELKAAIIEFLKENGQILLRVVIIRYMGKSSEEQLLQKK